MMLSRLTEVLEKLALTSSVKKASMSFEKSNEMWFVKLAAMMSDGLCGPPLWKPRTRLRPQMPVRVMDVIGVRAV